MILPLDLLNLLTAFPHRGAGTHYEREAAQIITQTLQNDGFEVENQPFLTPPTYVSIVYWLIGGVLLGLLSVPWVGFWSVLLVAFFAINGLLYFDWRPSLALFVPKLVRSQNIIGKTPTAAPAKLILMAHYDSAPVSTLYKRQTKDGFRNSIRVSMLLLALAVPVAGLSYHLPDNFYLLIIRILLCCYFVGQAILGTIGYWQKGYTNGASDNATGVVAAIETARKLRNQLKNTQIEVVLTSAEEAGMIGAYHYWKKLNSLLKTDSTGGLLKKSAIYLINFDTLGSGRLKIITQTGSMTLMEYDNLLTQTALKIVEKTPRLKHVTIGSWHTADFDNAWFARSGFTSMTLAALDSNGLMPNIHRPEDTIDHVDTQPMFDAILLAEAIGLALDSAVILS